MSQYIYHPETVIPSAAGKYSDSSVVTALAGGGYLVTWQTAPTGDFNSLYDIYQQEFDAEGDTVGASVLVNSTTAGYQRYVDTAKLLDGGWVSTWFSSSQDGLYQQRYDDEGTAVGGETRVSSGIYSSIVGLNGGGWAVAYSWINDQGKYELSTGIFNSAGTTLTTIDIIPNNNSDVYELDMNASNDGGMLLTWSEATSDESKVYVGKFDSNGNKIFSEEVGSGNESSSELHGQSTVLALSDGNILVAWRSYDASDTNFGDLLFQLYDASGDAIGDPTLVQSDIVQNRDISVTELSTGGWVFGWSQVPGGDTIEDVAQRRYHADGTAAGDVETVGSTIGNQWQTTVTALDDGAWVVSWTSWTGNGVQNIHHEVFKVADRPTLVNELSDVKITEDKAATFTIPETAFAGPDDIDLTFTALLVNGDELPVWLTFDPVTKKFSGTPANDDVGSITVRVTASDGVHDSVSDDFVIAITNVNDAPTVAHAIDDRSVEEDTDWKFVVPVDTFVDIDGDTLIYTAAPAGGGKLPSWLSFDSATCTFTGTPPKDFNGVISLRLTASDGKRSVFDTFDLTVTAVNDVPTNLALSGTTVKENVSAGTVVGSLTASDADSGDHLVFSLASNPDDKFAIDGGELVVAAGAKIDFETQSSYKVTVRATDDGGSHLDRTFTVKVTDVIDQVTGTAKADTLEGGSGIDLIKGLRGNDTIEGGKGVDRLYGGAGADLFVFTTGDSGKTHTTADTIYDFTRADRVDLTGWDANARAKGVQGFDFIGADAFNGKSGELHFTKGKSDTWIEGDTNGDGKADFAIHIDGTFNLRATNFDL